MIRFLTHCNPRCSHFGIKLLYAWSRVDALFGVWRQGELEVVCKMSYM